MLIWSAIIATTLATLPTELLFLITSHLNNQRDILNLASTTRALHTLLYTRAFTSVRLDDDSHYQLTRLVHILARNPECARAVRVLRFEPFLYRDPRGVRAEDNVEYDAEFIRPIIERLSAAFAASPETRADVGADAIVAKWETLLRKGVNIEPWTALLLALVPNVGELSLKFHHESYHTRKLYLVATETRSG
jgi:hypothetical protein